MSGIGTGTIVVGVDGSPTSQAALRWAVEEARHRRCPVVAIFAWHRDNGLMIGPTPAEFGMELTSERVREDHRTVLDEAVRECAGLGLRGVLAEGDPRSVLIEVSRTAVLLVVGNRGAGPVAEAITGSVSSHCVRNSACPVVVIREARRKSVPARPLALSRAGQGQATRSGSRRRSTSALHEVDQ